MRSTGLAVFFVISFAASPMLASASGSLVGVEVPPMPTGCQSRESGVLGPEDSFVYDRMSCNGQEVVVLQKLIRRQGKVAHWNVIDELRLPKALSKRTPLEVPLCMSSSFQNESVLAIAQWGNEKDGSFLAKRISHAWRFNLAKGKIEPISTQEVSCAGVNPD